MQSTSKRHAANCATCATSHLSRSSAAIARAAVGSSASIFAGIAPSGWRRSTLIATRRASCPLHTQSYQRRPSAPVTTPIIFASLEDRAFLDVRLEIRIERATADRCFALVGDLIERVAERNAVDR
jgi:hypothetical protein